MDYEKKYNEALKKAKEYKNHGYMMINVAIDNIFPELKESEDERLKREIEMIKGDYEQVDVAWNNDFDFIAKHFFELGLKAKGN